MNQQNGFMPSKFVCFDYYDGPKSGVLQCGTCQAEYLFDFLDWDDCQDVRIFSLSPVPEDTIYSISQILSQHSEPTWPVWVPLWNFPTATEQKRIEIEINTILGKASPPIGVVAWERDLAVGFIIHAYRLVESDKLNAVTDWFNYLDIPKRTDCD